LSREYTERRFGESLPEWEPAPPERIAQYDVWLVWPNGTRERRQFECRILEPSSPAPPRGRAEFALEVRKRVTLPSPEIRMAPERDGLTGLPTHLWASVPPVVSTPRIEVTGRIVEAEARPERFHWDTGDAGTPATQTAYGTTSGGSGDQPAVSHVYERSSAEATGSADGATYTVSVRVVWSGRYRVLGIADPCNDWCSLEGLQTSASRPYRVTSVVGVLCGDGGCPNGE
jgi:hypothetical protein